MSLPYCATLKKPVGNHRSQVCGLPAVALPAQQLQILSRSTTAQRYRDYMIVLKIEIAAAFGTSPAIALEDDPAHFTWNGLPSARWTLCGPILDVEKHVSPVQALRCPPLALSDKR
jgi:hypothetical protein